MKYLIRIAIGTAFVLTPVAAIAGPDEDMRDAARAEASSLRAQGWPRDACYVGVGFSNNIVVQSSGDFLPGDRLISINSTNLEGANTDVVREAFASIAPRSTVAMQIERNGDVLSFEHQCGNLSDYQRPYLQALDFAGHKDWRECIENLSGRPDDSFYLSLRIRCAQVSGDVEDYPIQQWMDRGMQILIARGAFSQESRLEIATNLQRARMNLSKPVYDRLVGEVISWDNGEVWQSLQPNIENLRQVAERGVLRRLVDPQSAIIEMPYDFIFGTWSSAFARVQHEGFITCGTVNARNRMGGYTGATTFVSVVDAAGFERFTEMDGTTSDYFRPVDAACARLIQRLNFVEESNNNNTLSDGQAALGRSVSEELETLNQLHESGALSDEEFDAAKARVIQGN